MKYDKNKTIKMFVIIEINMNFRCRATVCNRQDKAAFPPSIIKSLFGLINMQ